MAAGPEGVDGLAGWVMAWQLARRQAWSVSLFDLEAVSSFSNRGHERKRFFPAFLSSLALPLSFVRPRRRLSSAPTVDFGRRRAQKLSRSAVALP
jgi:hypothetical protein